MPGIEKELSAFVIAVLSGASVRLMYRCLSCFREIVKHNMLVINIEDLLFWTGAAFYLYVQIYQTSGGGIRWYFVLGVVAGAVLATFLAKKVENLRKKIYIFITCEKKKNKIK